MTPKILYSRKGGRYFFATGGFIAQKWHQLFQGTSHYRKENIMSGSHKWKIYLPPPGPAKPAVHFMTPGR